MGKVAPITTGGMAMTDTKQPSIEEIVSSAKELAELTGERLRQFRETVYKIAAEVLHQILGRYPEIATAKGAAINVIMPRPFPEERFCIFHISRIQLADGKVVQGICHMANDGMATPVFLKLPEEVHGRNFLPDQLMISRGDRNDVVEPSINLLFQFLNVVVADLPAVLDHIEVWPAKNA